MKKLVALISTKGKTPEQISQEAWAAVQNYKQKMSEAEKEILAKRPALRPSSSEEQKIPEGFNKCEVCGEYKGKTKRKNLNNGDRWGKSLTNEELEEHISVSCLCDGILCQKCKKNNIHRPISNTYYPEDNTVWHNSYLSGMLPCDECRGQKKAQ